MIGIVAYGAGNVGNLMRAFHRLGQDVRLMEHPEEAPQATLLVLPGVGAFPPAVRQLEKSGWAETLQDAAHRGQPLLGICLGMQLLAEESREDGTTPGLGLIRGTVMPLEGLPRIPHMGWNSLHWSPGDPWAPSSPAWCYFVHGFALWESPDAVATCEVAGRRFVAAVRRGSVAGCQFHPERSGPEGVAFLGHLTSLLIAGACS